MSQYEDDDFDPENPDEAALDLSILKPESKEKIILEPPTSGKIPRSIDEALEIQEKLPDMDIQFKLVEDKAERLVDLKTVDSEIAPGETMDTGLAEAVQESFGGLYDSIPKQTFTNIPTRTNYQKTRNYMQNRIALESLELMDLYKTYLSGPMTQAKEALVTLVERQIPGLVRVSTSLASEVRSIQDRLGSNPSNVVPTTTGEFINLYTTDISVLDPLVIKTTLKTLPRFQRALRTMGKALSDHGVRHTVCRLGSEDPEQYSKLGVMPHDHHEPIGFDMLVRYITSPEYPDLLENLVKDITDQIAHIDTLLANAQGLETKPEELSDYIVEHAPAFMKFHDTVARNNNLVYGLTMLNLALEEMLVTYLEL